MKEPLRKKNNQDRLSKVYPSVARRIARTITSLESVGIRPRIQEAWRSPEEQRQAYEAGHSKLLYGFHNVTGRNGKPEALAIDLYDDNAPLNPSKRYLLMLAAAAERESLVTGIRWGLPKRLREAIDAAIEARDWGADVKIGWDPCHVQATGITVSEARRGKRPT